MAYLHVLGTGFNNRNNSYRDLFISANVSCSSEEVKSDGKSFEQKMDFVL